ncbi:hypothetical protein MAR_030358 [Mya arenaria]|uniref:Uncharacterized protein n=1 Tax=Mya arenaria TaxID=6604 RepID=A0ABY7DKE8_MYAAR|nr:hypothetical protein MAR_030358 [Mya arenaria]
MFDVEMSNLINAIREVSYGGKLSDSTICLCKNLSRELQSEKVTKLFARNDFVDDLNRRNILDHPGELVQYDSEDSAKRVNELQGTVTSLDREGPTVEFPTVETTIKLSKFQFEVVGASNQLKVAK